MRAHTPRSTRSECSEEVWFAWKVLRVADNEAYGRDSCAASEDGSKWEHSLWIMKHAVCRSMPEWQVYALKKVKLPSLSDKDLGPRKRFQGHEPLQVSAQAANRSWPDDYSVAPDGMLALAWLVTAAAHSATASRNSATSERLREIICENGCQNCILNCIPIRAICLSDFALGEVCLRHGLGPEHLANATLCARVNKQLQDVADSLDEILTTAARSHIDPHFGSF